MTENAGERISQDEANRVLSRAVEIDASIDGTISLDRLREVALEVGISSTALRRALDEAKLATRPRGGTTAASGGR